MSTGGSYASVTNFGDVALSPEVSQRASLESRLENGNYIAEESADDWVFRKMPGH